MGLFLLPLAFLGAWLLDQYNEYKGNKAYKELQEEYKRMGLKK